MASSARDKAAVSGPALIPAGELAGRPPIPLTRPITVAGSRNNCRIHLISRTVSKAHCLIVLTRHTVFVRDLASHDGTFVNGERIVEQDLGEGDILKVGRFEFIFATGGARLRPHREKQVPPATVKARGSDAPPVPLEGRVSLAGRRPACDIAFVDESVSTAHAVFVAWEGRRYVRDLGSRTGTFINGKQIHQQEIHPGDQIRIGADDLVYEVSEAGAGVEVVASPTESAVAKAIGAQEIESVPISPDDTLSPAEKPKVPAPAARPVRDAAPVSWEEEAPARSRPASPLADAPAEEEPIDAPAADDAQAQEAAAPSQEAAAPSQDAAASDAASEDHAPGGLSRRGWHRTGGEEPRPEAEAQAEDEVTATANLPVDAPDTAQADSTAEEGDSTATIEALAEESTERFKAEPASYGARAESFDEIVEAADPDNAQPLDSIDPDATASADDPTMAPQADQLTDTFVSRELGSLSGTSAGEPIIEQADAGAVEPIDLGDAPGAAATIDVAQVETIDLSAPPPEECVERAEAAPEPINLAGPPIPLKKVDLSQPQAIELSPPRSQAVLETTPAEAIELSSPAARAAVEIRLERSIELVVPPEPIIEVPAAGAPVKLTEPAIAPPAAAPQAVAAVPLSEPPPIDEPPAAPIAPIAEAPLEPEPEIAIPSAHLPPLREAAPEPDIAVPSAHLPPLREAAPEPDIAVPSVHLPPLKSPPAEPDIAVPSAHLPPVVEFDHSQDLGIPSIHIPEFTPAEPEEDQSDAPLPEAVEATIDLPAEAAEEPPVAEPPVEQVPLDEAPLDDLPATPDVEEPQSPAPEEIAAIAEPANPEPEDFDHDDQPSLDEAQIEELLAEAQPATVDDVSNLPESAAPGPAATDAATEDDGKAAEELSAEVPPLSIEQPAPPAEAAANQPLALDEVVPEIPLTVTSDESDVLEIAALEGHDTAFALTVPQSKVPRPPRFEEKPTEPIEPPGGEPPSDAETTATIALPPPLPDDLQREPLSPDVPAQAPLSLEPAPIDAPGDPEVQRVESESQASRSSATASLAQSSRSVPTPQPRQSEALDELDLSPPPIPPDAPALDDEMPGVLVPPAPRKPAVIRDDFKQRRRRRAGESASPFAGSQQAISGADPFAPIDAFAQPSPLLNGAMDLSQELPASELASQEHARRGDAVNDRRPLRDRRASDPLSPRPALQPQPVFAPTIPTATPVAPPEEVPDLHELRRRRLKLIPTVLIAAIALMFGAGAAIWYLFPVYNELEAAIKFEGFGALTILEQKNLQAEQAGLIRQDVVRKRADRELRNAHPELSSGFLASTIGYDRVIRGSGWPDNRPGEFVLRYRSSDDGDRARLHALSTAIFADERNQRRIDKSVGERNAIKRLEDDIDSNTRKLADLRQQIERERMLGEKRPRPGQIEELESAVLAVEKTWTESLARLKHAQAEEGRIEKLVQAARDNPPTAPENDAELEKFARELTDLQAEYKALQARQSEQATVARQEIDSAMDAFQKQIEEARGKGDESPELIQYVAAAESLQRTTRELLDEMLNRQQTQYQRLNDLKLRLDEKAAARAAELRNSDPQLRELTDEREVLRRQINAGIGADGAVERNEIASLQERLKLVENMVKSREEVLSSDPLYVEAITSLQTIIDQTQADIAADRKKADEKLAELQRSFASTSSAVANLPEEQKQVALEVRRQLASITSARQRYADVLENDRLANEAKLKEMQARIIALQGDIDTRKRILSDEFVNKSVTALTASLDKQRKSVAQAQEAESQARADFESKGRELRGLKDTVEALKNTDERMARLIAETEQTEGFLKSLNDQLEYKRANAATALLEIRPPGESDIKVIAGKDHRLTYLLTVPGAILLLASGLIWWMVHSAHRIDFAPAAPDFAPANHDPVSPPQSAKPIDTNGGEEHPAVV